MEALMSNPDEKEFKAWLDKMPGANNSLHVTGKVTVPTTGWTATLIEAVPQGIVREILVLEVKKVKPDRASGDMVSHVPVRFDKPDSFAYFQVTIIGDGEEFTIPVEIVE
jgi:hypothetical protein